MGDARVQGGVVRGGRGRQQPPRDRHARRRGTPRSATRSSTTTASPARSCSPAPTPRPARWARRSAPGSTRSATTDPEHLLAGAACVQPLGGRDLCQDSPERRAGLIVAPILGDLDGAHRRDPARPRRGAARRHHHPAAVGRPRVYTSYSYDPVWALCAGARAARALPLGPRRAQGLRRTCRAG